MATEAQRLIGISLTKIAQSRSHRGGVSLHKNLLVATVLQKARYIFMEEAYHMVHTGSYCPSPTAHVPHSSAQSASNNNNNNISSSSVERSYGEEQLVALTAEEAGLGGGPQLDSIESTVESTLQDFLQPACVRCSDEQRDKENVPPPCYQASAATATGAELTYLDLDKSGSAREPASCLKRRRAVTEWEIEEAVLSILPKRSRLDDETSLTDTTVDVDSVDDSVFLDDAALFSDSVAREAAAEREHEDPTSPGSAMEIDRITSLVSIFSFGNLSSNSSVSTDGLGKLARSVSTPDLCSAQAKDAVDALQQRPFLAMTV